jgi:hypothetical protein
MHVRNKTYRIFAEFEIGARAQEKRIDCFCGFCFQCLKKTQEAYARSREVQCEALRYLETALALPVHSANSCLSRVFLIKEYVHNNKLCTQKRGK